MNVVFLTEECLNFFSIFALIKHIVLYMLNFIYIDKDPQMLIQYEGQYFRVTAPSKIVCVCVCVCVCVYIYIYIYIYTGCFTTLGHNCKR
jgi:hypothetical protein